MFISQESCKIEQKALVIVDDCFYVANSVVETVHPCSCMALIASPGQIQLYVCHCVAIGGLMVKQFVQILTSQKLGCPRGC